MGKKVIGLRCRECGKLYPPAVQNTCLECFGPLDVAYDWDEVASRVSRDSISRGPPSIWRYNDLLPLENDRVVDLGAGFNRLHHAKNLGDNLGLHRLYVLDDSVNPTYSFKDRVTSVATSKAFEFGCEAIVCASTGNLGCSVAAHAAKAGLPAYIFIPQNIEPGKIAQLLAYEPQIITIDGNYDDANRLAVQVVDLHPTWAFMNINMRPWYTEGSRTLAFEAAEQLGWNAPDRVIVPMGSGALLCAIHRGFNELVKVGLLDGQDVAMCGTQPLNCNPITRAVEEGEEVRPIRQYDTIAHSLAIGDPADGYYTKRIIESTGGAAASPTEEQVIDGIKLLARTEGIFTEPAGGTAVAGLKLMVERGQVEPDELVVLYATGNGLKAQETLLSSLTLPQAIKPTVNAFQKLHLGPVGTGSVKLAQEA